MVAPTVWSITVPMALLWPTSTFVRGKGYCDSGTKALMLAVPLGQATMAVGGPNFCYRHSKINPYEHRCQKN
jgi:hypothetical protein